MRLYRRADRDKDGELDAREFARVFDVEASNPFLPRLVRLFDVSGDGKLSPFEFIACLSQFTSSDITNRDAHVAFAWRLFDTNDDKSMSKAEFREALSATYLRRDDAPRQPLTRGGGRNRKVEKSETSSTSSTARVVGDGGMRRGRGLANFGGTGGLAKGLDNIMHDVDGDKDGRVTAREFSRMTRDYPHVIAPAFDLWTKLGEVGRPATRARREIEKAGNGERLAALALQSSEARRGEIGPEVIALNTRRVTRARRREAPSRDVESDVFSAYDAKPPKIKISKIRKSSWRLPSFSSPRTPPPPKTAYELEMEAACASTDEEADAW